MNYYEGIEYMMSLSNQSGFHSPYPGIIINYPGRKDEGDYILTVQGGQAPTHSVICRTLYDLIENGHCNFLEIMPLIIIIISNNLLHNVKRV
ncbi:hypothetical protein [Clostridium beijerinckii]|uniref:Uncharacterized protein n=1 Tax=Clostridium beijerinckii TaxID=1520 RepID=A0A9Q5CMJ9_CLOBE|nr:hypothetical protein [Clostridium beijerinckii]AQS05559.1 hypothetical protein CLBIJ_29920 [Clostridium beijerinckii]MBA2884936.1 hypothetical protein [Clostridium beijerinckii]MBA2899690.1 hypothetical protein [Clostridium beijerinckii]MBA2909287.1 hypothetical protein [Clostridium beijerinckii]MBA9014860.1 hypothetical protein [Clostridium beijerinckii]